MAFDRLAAGRLGWLAFGRLPVDDVDAYQQALLARQYKDYRPGICDTE